MIMRTGILHSKFCIPNYLNNFVLMFQKHLKIFFELLVIFVLFSSCENDIEKVKLLSSRPVEPIRSDNNIRILYSDSSKVQAEFLAPELNYYEKENGYAEMPRGLKASFLDDSMRVKSRMTADYG